MKKIPERLLRIICCPDCKSNLNYNKAKLICKKCKKEFRVSNGIPVFVSD